MNVSTEKDLPGIKARAGVRTEIARFFQLPFRERCRIPLLYFLLGEGTNAFKMGKREALYVDKPATTIKVCGKCRSCYQNVSSGFCICSQVSGRISLVGTCRLWASRRRRRKWRGKQ